MIVFRTDEERDRGLVETSPLSIPLLDGIKGALPGQVEHEENRDRVVAHEREHVHELALAAEIPDRECNLGVPYRDSLFHEIDAWIPLAGGYGDG